jgi:sulfate transport system ATP-binding protein
VDQGLARLDETGFAPGDGGNRASIYVRPHLLEIHRAKGHPEDLRARVLRIHSAGPTVKVELVTEGNGAVQAEISQQHYEDLRLARGEEVYVRPRQKRVFVEDYSI